MSSTMSYRMIHLMRDGYLTISVADRTVTWTSNNPRLAQHPLVLQIDPLSGFTHACPNTSPYFELNCEWSTATLFEKHSGYAAGNVHVFGLPSYRSLYDLLSIRNTLWLLGVPSNDASKMALNPKWDIPLLMAREGSEFGSNQAVLRMAPEWGRMSPIELNHVTPTKQELEWDERWRAIAPEVEPARNAVLPTSTASAEPDLPKKAVNTRLASLTGCADIHSISTDQMPIPSSVPIAHASISFAHPGGQASFCILHTDCS